MRLFTVHIPPAVPRPGRDPVVVVPEGFAWGALAFGPFWLVHRQLWLPLLGWVGLALLLTLLPTGWAAATGIGLWWFTALAAQDLRRWQLDRRGWDIAGVVAAAGETQALQRALEQEPELLPA